MDTTSTKERLDKAQVADARTRGKHEAVKDYEHCDGEADVTALIEHAKEQHDKAPSGRSKAYWLAYWGRVLDMRRAAMQARKVYPGSLRAS